MPATSSSLSATRMARTASFPSDFRAQRSCSTLESQGIAVRGEVRLPALPGRCDLPKLATASSGIECIRVAAVSAIASDSSSPEPGFRDSRARSELARHGPPRYELTARTHLPQDERDRHPGRGRLDEETPIQVATGHRLLRSHAGAGRQARRLLAPADVRGRPAHRRAPHRRGLRAGAGPGIEDGARRQARHPALRLPAADGRGAGAGRHRSVGPAVLRVRRPVRPRPRR